MAYPRRHSFGSRGIRGVGSARFAFGVWGDTVNVASRLESASEPDRINISAATHALVNAQFACEYRGKHVVKGKGEIDMYFIVDVTEKRLRPSKIAFSPRLATRICARLAGVRRRRSAAQSNLSA